MHAGASVGSSQSSSVLSEILVLPVPKPSQQRSKRQAVNSKARCITDMDVLEELKAKEQKKVEEEEEKKARRLERERERKAREIKKKNTNGGKGT